MVSGVATKEGIKVQVNRIVKAKRSRVFEAWTKPELIQRWYGPTWMSVSSTDVDLRVGGSFRIAMVENGTRPEGIPKPTGDVIATGTYEEIVPNELLRFSFRGTWDPANPDMLVTVRFADVDGGTEVKLIHERFASDERVGGYTQGWEGSLEKLARACEA